MSFVEYLRKKESEGGISAFAIVKETIKFLSKNMLPIVVIAALVLALFTGLTGVTLSGPDIIGSGELQENESVLKEFMVLLAPFLHATIVTVLIVMFINKAKNSEYRPMQQDYLSAIAKVYLLTILGNLFAILLGGVLGMLVFLLDIFLILTVIVTYLYAFFINTIQNAICEEPHRTLKNSILIGFETFFKKKFILKALVLVLISTIVIFSIEYIFDMAIGVKFNIVSKTEISKAIKDMGIKGNIFVFMHAFVTNIFTIIIQMSFASIYLIYSKGETFENGDDERLNDLINKLNEDKKEKEKEEKNDFFEIYNNNMYKGKDDE